MTFSHENDMTTLDAALQQFEATEANLAKLDTLWERIENLMPGGPAFGSPPEYEELCRKFRRILPSLPAIDGFRVEDCLYDYDDIGAMHLGALEFGEFEDQVAVNNDLEKQGGQLREYRFRLQAKRRDLVRDRLLKLIDEMDQIFSGLTSAYAGSESNTTITEPSWNRLKEAVTEIHTLLGATNRPSEWVDLQQHLDISTTNGWSDIFKFDWPAVSKSLREQIYGDHDPVPVEAEDLGKIVDMHPVGPVITQLDWAALNAEDFERLVFLLISGSPEYENSQWLQKTNAPDRGRDLSVNRVDSNSLSGVRRYRTIIQCKHWLSQSIGTGDIGKTKDQMALWEPPRVDELVIATTGRFTADAVSFVEKHNQKDHALHIVMWPDNHLERILATRPDLIGQFQLRRRAG